MSVACVGILELSLIKAAAKNSVVTVAQASRQKYVPRFLGKIILRQVAYAAAAALLFLVSWLDES